MFAAALMHLAATLQRQHQFSRDVIEYLFRESGLTPWVEGAAQQPTAARTGEHERLYARARASFEAHFDSLAREVLLSMSYVQTQYPDSPVQRVVLTGGGAGVPGLADYLGPPMEVPVHVLVPKDAATVPESLHTDAASPALTTAMGLAMHNPKAAA